MREEGSEGRKECGKKGVRLEGSLHIGKRGQGD